MQLRNGWRNGQSCANTDRTAAVASSHPLLVSRCQCLLSTKPLQTVARHSRCMDWIEWRMSFKRRPLRSAPAQLVRLAILSRRRHVSVRHVACR